MIRFSKLRWKNLLSTGNAFTEIDLDVPGTTIMVGANGAGKSTFLDALFYAMYGKPFRKISKTQMINSINKRELVVELEFQIGDTSYMIRRGQKPSVFDIVVDGERRNAEGNANDTQDWLERNVLRMNFKAASQVVALGAASFVPFMELVAAHRREVIEDLLDVQVFGVMNNLLKDRVTALQNEMRDTDTRREIVSAKIAAGEKFLAAMRDDVEGQAIILKDKIAVAEAERKTKAAEGMALINKISELSATITDKDNRVEERSKLVNLMSQNEELIRAYDKDIKYFAEHNSCAECKQSIAPEWAQSMTAKAETMKRDLLLTHAEYTLAFITIKDRIAAIYQVESEISELNVDKRIIGETVSGLTKRIDELKSALVANEARAISAAADYDVEAIRDELENIDRTRAAQAKRRQLLASAGALLKDGGVKTSVIRQYIPVMNKLINKYLADLEADYAFELNEEFEETIKSRYRDDFSYASFSEGEKTRINLSILFAWRAIARIRNTASTNIVIMDEIFDSSLDTSGADDFMSLLNSLSKESNAFIISHRTDQLSDKFDRVIKFEKKKNFSQVAA